MRVACDSDHFVRELLGIEIWTCLSSLGFCSEREFELKAEVVGRVSALGDTDGLSDVEVVREVHIEVLVDGLAPSEAEVPGVLKEALDSEGGGTVKSVDASP